MNNSLILFFFGFVIWGKTTKMTWLKFISQQQVFFNEVLKIIKMRKSSNKLMSLERKICPGLLSMQISEKWHQSKGEWNVPFMPNHDSYIKLSSQVRRSPFFVKQNC